MKKILFILLFSFVLIATSQENKENTDFKLAVNLFNDKLYDLALDQFRLFVESYPNTQQAVQAQFYIALSQFEQKKYEEAKNLFQNFALTFQLDPKAPEAWWKIAECNQKLGKLNDAALVYERIKVFHPTSALAPQGLLESANCYIEQNNYDNALRVLKVLLSEYFSDAITLTARNKLASVYLNMRMTNEAIEEYKKIIINYNARDVKSDAQFRLAQLYASLGKVEEAEELFKDITINNSLNKIADSAYLELGKLYFDVMNYQNAKIYFLKVKDSTDTRKSDIDKISIFYLAYVEFHLKDYLSSLRYIQNYEDKYDIDSLTYKLWYLAGEIHQRLSDFVKSNEYYLSVINSGYDELDIKKSYQLYAQNCIEIRNYNEAIEYFTKYIENYPNDPLNAELTYRTANIYFEYLKDYRRAVTKYEELLSKQSMHRLSDDALFYMAYSYEQNKELDKSLGKYNDLLNNYSNSNYYKSVLNKIKHINLFVSNNNGDGFKKIGILLQDVINNKPKSEISFKLGEVYFNDMKDYQSALAQFDIVLSSNDLSDSLKNFTNYYIVMSSYYLAMDNNKSINESVSQLSKYLNSNPNGIKRNEIILNLFYLDTISKSNEEKIKLCYEYLKKYPDFDKQDELYYSIMNLSLNSKEYNNSLQCCEKIITDYSNTSFYEEAIYIKAYSTFLMSKDTLSESLFNEYINKYKNGKFVAKSYYLLAEICINKKEYVKVLEYYNKIKNIYPYTAKVDNLMDLYANLYFESGDYSNSFKQYKTLYSINEKNIFFDKDELNYYIYRLAESAERYNDIQSAIRYYKQYIYNSPNGEHYNSALLNLGLIYQREGKAELALSYFNMVSNVGSDYEFIMKIANLFYEAGQYKQALSNYSLILSAGPNKYKKEALFKITIINYRNNNITEAEKFKKAYNKEFNLTKPESAELAYEEALLHYKNKNHKGALSLFSDVINDYERSIFAANSAFYKGRILDMSDKFQDALKSYVWVIERFPDSEPASEASLYIANHYFRSEKYSDAVRYYRNVVDKPKKDKISYSVALENLIEACYQLNLYDAALEYCRKYIDLYPNDKDIADKKIKMGELYQKLQYFDQAIVHYKSLLNATNQPIEAEIRYYIGECYFSKGDFQNALLEFMKIPYINNKNSVIDWVPAALYMSGQSYEKMNKYEQAISVYRQIIEKPNIESIYKARAQKEIDRVRTLAMPTNKDDK
jgi:TolA-binding protein